MLDEARELTQDNEVYLADNCLYKTYITQDTYKTHLLGLDQGCDKQFRIVPVTNTVFASPCLSDVTQGDMGTCTFLAALRAIVRRYPNFVSNMIKEVDEKRVAVNFFRTEGRIQPISCIVDKTIVEPIKPWSLLNNIYTIFSSTHNQHEKPWVKLIEKALVLECMQSGYHPNLMNMQMHGRDFSLSSSGKMLTPSYEDVVYVIGNDDIYSRLLGCKRKSEHFYLDKSKAFIKNELLAGELISVEFFDNKFGVEDHHTYDVVDFAVLGSEEYVILSNPWGFNSKKSAFNYKNLDLSFCQLLVNSSLEAILNDKGIIILRKDDFEKGIKGCHFTSGASQLLRKQQGEKTSLPTSNQNT